MSTLITGGLGFIGSHLAKALPDARVYDRKDKATFSNFQHAPAYNTIFHLAASTYLTEGYDKQMIDDNIVLTTKIFKEPSRIIYASSAAIYNPNNLYSYTKRYNEDIAPAGATGLRYYNVYGHGDNGIVSKLIKSALTGEPITIYGGAQTRDFIHVDDVVRETIKAVGSTEKIIEIGTGIETSINDLIYLVQDISGKIIKATYLPFKSIEAYRSRCATPISESIPLVPGLSKTIKQYEDFYRNS